VNPWTIQANRGAIRPFGKLFPPPKLCGSGGKENGVRECTDEERPMKKSLAPQKAVTFFAGERGAENLGEEQNSEPKVPSHQEKHLGCDEKEKRVTLERNLNIIPKKKAKETGEGKTWGEMPPSRGSFFVSQKGAKLCRTKKNWGGAWLPSRNSVVGLLGIIQRKNGRVGQGKGKIGQHVTFSVWRKSFSRQNSPDSREKGQVQNIRTPPGYSRGIKWKGINRRGREKRDVRTRVKPPRVGGFKGSCSW